MIFVLLGMVFGWQRHHILYAALSSFFLFLLFPPQKLSLLLSSSFSFFFVSSSPGLGPIYFFCSWWWWPAFCALLRRAGGERRRRLAPLRTQGIERGERFDKFVSKKMDQTPFPISSFSGSKFRLNIDTLTYPLLIFFLSFTTVPQNQKKKRLFLHLQRLFQTPLLFFSPFLSFSFSPFLEAGSAKKPSSSSSSSSSDRRLSGRGAINPGFLFQFVSPLVQESAMWRVSEIGIPSFPSFFLKKEVLPSLFFWQIPHVYNFSVPVPIFFRPPCFLAPKEIGKEEREISRLLRFPPSLCRVYL